MKSFIIILFVGFFAVLAISRHVLIETVDAEEDDGTDVGNPRYIDFRQKFLVYISFIRLNQFY